MQAAADVSRSSNPLLDRHEAAGAELQAYGPLQIVSTFGEPQAEYAAIRKGCALLDQPHRGLLQLIGKDRLSFLNNLVSNVTWDKATKTPLAGGTGIYSVFLNLRGRIVADFSILELGDRTLVETDARFVDMLHTTWGRYLFVEQVKMASELGQLSQIALIGPSAAGELAQLGGVPPAGPLASTQFAWCGVPIVVWRDDACGVPGFNLIVPTADVGAVWEALFARFADDVGHGRRAIRPIGWAAFNTARIEAGRPIVDIDLPAAPPDRPGAKLDPAEAKAMDGEAATPAAGVLPAEAGPAFFARAISLSKCYVGQEIVARMHARKAIARQLVGIRMAGDALPIAGAPIMDAGDNQIGIITSSTVSPLLSGACIALGMVKRPHFADGTALCIPAEGAIRDATIMPLPFVA